MRLHTALLAPFADAIDQIGEELRCLDQLLARHVARLRRDGKFNEDPLRGLYIGDDEALAALRQTTTAPEDDAQVAPGPAVLEARGQRSPDVPLATISR